jgi:hypothetical protein
MPKICKASKVLSPISPSRWELPDPFHPGEFAIFGTPEKYQQGGIHRVLSNIG